MTHLHRSLLLVATVAVTAIRQTAFAQKSRRAGALILAVLMVGGQYAAAADKLEQGFTRPPHRAKTWTYWNWVNGNITKKGITADLEAMASVGIGGMHILNTSISNIPRGPMQFMTAEWRECFVHAAKEADRLGLEINMHNCDGWSGSFGPWITPKQSMQHLTFSETIVAGPTSLEKPLPKPSARAGYYRDIAVYAFKTPAAEGLPMRACKPRITRKGDGIDIEFPKPFTARSIVIPTDYSCELHVSGDGKEFKKVCTIPANRGSRTTRVVTLPAASFPAVEGRFFRLSFPRKNASSIKLDKLELVSGARIHATAIKAGFFAHGPIEDGLIPLPALQDEAGTSIPLDEIVDVTAKMKPDGSLSWKVPEGRWTILRIGHTSTGVHTERLLTPATKEGRGLECDKMSKKALDVHFDNFLAKIIADCGSSVGKEKGFAYAFIESWEVGSQTWTLKFPEEFQARRGYDPLPYLPVMTGRIVASREVSERFLYDFRRTVADLIADNYYGHFQTLMQRHGMGTVAEAYGSPGWGPVLDDLQCAGRVDVPMCEFWHKPGGYLSYSQKQVASSAHTYGKRIVAAEAFTAWGAISNWQNYPYVLKIRGDLAFTDGVNQIGFTEGHTHQPFPNVVPGMTTGQYGMHFDRTTTWWNQSVGWTAYLTRCQYLLQEGLFVADVAYSAGEGAPVAHRSDERLYREGYTPELPAGYDHDACAAEVIIERMSVRNGRLLLPDGMSYRLLVLPETSGMTLETCKKIQQLVQAGATVMGPKPAKSPSLSGYPDCDSQMQGIAAEVWGNVDGKSVKERTYGKGRIIWGKTLAEVFAEMGIKPDFEYTLGNSPAKLSYHAITPGNGGLYEAELNYIHRVSGGTDIYFVASRSDRPVASVCTFRVGARRPEFWHPDSGRIEECPRYRLTKDGRIEVPIHFDPSGSVFVIFREPLGERIVEIKKDGKTLNELSPVPPVELHETASGTVEMLAFAAGDYELLTAKGKSLQVAVSAVPRPFEIKGPWEVRFQEKRGAPAKAVFDRLISWPEHNEAGIKYFSGTATYVKKFTLSEELLDTDLVLELDLGRVAVIASAKLNGKDLGILWKPPFRVEITGMAKPGRNALEISVTNLWPNRMIGDDEFPADVDYKLGGVLRAWPDWLVQGKERPEPRRITFTSWKFWKKGDKLLESGLLGPVTIQAAVKRPISY